MEGSFVKARSPKKGTWREECQATRNIGGTLVKKTIQGKGIEKKKNLKERR